MENSDAQRSAPSTLTGVGAKRGMQEQSRGHPALAPPPWRRRPHRPTLHLRQGAVRRKALRRRRNAVLTTFPDGGVSPPCLLCPARRLFLLVAHRA